MRAVWLLQKKRTISALAQNRRKQTEPMVLNLHLVAAAHALAPVQDVLRLTLIALKHKPAATQRNSVAVTETNSFQFQSAANFAARFSNWRRVCRI